jgi:predicted nucleotidyltransferase
LPSALSAPPASPEEAAFRAYVAQLLEERPDVEFVVLFGSRARGTWLPSSDFDLLVGLGGDDGLRLTDRIGQLTQSMRANVDLFPYSRSEWEHMFADRHPLLLEALDSGQILFDRGSFAAMRRTFEEWLRTGKVARWHNGWRIMDEPTTGSVP